MKQPISFLKNVFSNFKIPTGQNFSDLIDSVFHKDEKIPASSVEGWTDDSAVEIVGNELPELDSKNKYLEVLGGAAGRTLTYKGTSFPITANTLTVMFWLGKTRTWKKQDENPLPAGADGRDIKPWSAKAYTYSSTISWLVTFEGILYENNTSTLATDIPGSSPKWEPRIGFKVPENFDEVEKFDQLSGNYDINESFVDNFNNWTVLPSYTVPFSIANNLLTLNLTTGANNGVRMFKTLEVGRTYPIEIRIRSTGAQQIVSVGTTISSTLSTNFNRITDLTSDFKVYNFNIIPLSGVNTQMCIAVMSSQNLGGTIEVDYIKVGSEAYGEFKLQSMQVLNKLNIKYKAGYDPLVTKLMRHGFEVDEISAKSLIYKNTAVSYTNAAIVPTDGYSTSKLIDLGSDWEECYVVPPLGTAYIHRTYRSNRQGYGIIRGTVEQTETPVVLKRVDNAEVRFIKLSFKDSEIDKFFCVVKSSNNKEILADRNKILKANINGKKVLNIQYNLINFPYSGYTHPSKGGTIVADPIYFTTGLRPIPTNWVQIILYTKGGNKNQFNIYDSEGNFLKGYIGINAADFYPQIIDRADAPRDAYFYAHSYNPTDLDNSLQIIVDESLVSKPLIDDQEYLSFGYNGTRLFNPKLVDFADKGIIPETVFDKTTLPNTIGGARIPSTIITNLNTVIVASEIRLDTFEDAGKMDVVIKRKAISDANWTLINVFPNDLGGRGRAMNPSFVVDRTGSQGPIGRIYMFVSTIKDPAKLALNSLPDEIDTIYRYSDDDGMTWSAISSIKGKWNAVNEAGLVGPSNGIQLQNGAFVFPAMVNRNKSWFSAAFYKSPTGDWIFTQMSSDGIDVQGNGDNESAVLEYEANKVLLNCRVDNPWVNKNLNRRVYNIDFIQNRLVLHKTDKTFYPYLANQMSFDKIRISYPEFTNTLYKTVFLATCADNSGVFNPAWDKDRKNITIWASLDLLTWIRVYVAQHEASFGYSVISVRDQKIALVYETGLRENAGVAYQDLSPIINEIREAIFVQLPRSSEEKMNELFFNMRNWEY